MHSPSLPQRQPPPQTWPHYHLWEAVRDILRRLPAHFRSSISVTGINAVEIFKYGQLLSGTIEEEVVRTLNEISQAWNPQGAYSDFLFVRQPEAFPDVVLVHRSGSPIIMGLELKSWYLLAKEGEPSFRFQVTPMACAQPDLLVVVPWVLSNVLSGNPIVFEPFIEPACYVAEFRNYWWQYIRQAKGDPNITISSGAQPYPPSRSQFVDVPAEDPGNNFGRIARIGLLDDYVQSFDERQILGFEIGRWRQFFKTAKEAPATKRNSNPSQ